MRKHGYEHWAYDRKIDEIELLIKGKGSSCTNNCMAKAVLLIFDYRMDAELTISYWKSWALTKYNKLTEDDLLIVVYGNNGSKHRYSAKNVVFYDYDKQTLQKAGPVEEFDEEVELMKDLYKRGKAVDKLTAMRRPDNIRYNVIAVYLLIAANIITFFIGDTQKYGFTAEAILIDGQSYRAFTSMFMHASFSHLAGNMLCLYIIGKRIEKIEGAINLIAIFICGGILSCLADCYLQLYFLGDISTLSVGASGAIYALLGALVVEAFTEASVERYRTKVLLVVIFLLITGNIGARLNIIVHIAGFLAGILITAALRVCDEVALEPQRNKLKKIRAKHSK